jgi:hypothetical protein
MFSDKKMDGHLNLVPDNYSLIDLTSKAKLSSPQNSEYFSEGRFFAVQ